MTSIKALVNMINEYVETNNIFTPKTIFVRISSVKNTFSSQYGDKYRFVPLEIVLTSDSRSKYGQDAKGIRNESTYTIRLSEIITMFGGKIPYIIFYKSPKRMIPDEKPYLTYLVISTKLETFNENEYYKHFTVKNNSYEKLYEILNERAETKINEMKELYKEQMNKSMELDEIEI